MARAAKVWLTGAMDATNPYAPPTAPLEATASASTPAPFYSVGTQKLILMALGTFGIYLFYYFYKQWQRYKEFAHVSIWPAVRAYFFQIMSFAFFARVADEGRIRAVRFWWHPGWMGCIVLFAPILGRILPPPFGTLLGLGSLVPVFLVNETVLEINGKADPDNLPDERFTAWNWVGIALGILLWSGWFYMVLHRGAETVDP